MPLSEYFARTYGTSPESVVLTSSGLIDNFLGAKWCYGSPKKWYDEHIGGEPRETTSQMWGGVMTHKMLLESWDLWTPAADTMFPTPALDALAMGGARVLAPLGWQGNADPEQRVALYIPGPRPTKPAPWSAKGQEAWETLMHDVEYRCGYRWQVVYSYTKSGYPNTTDVNVELDQALEILDWLRGDNLPPSAAEAVRLLTAPGPVEQEHGPLVYGDVKIQAKTDKILHTQDALHGAIVDIKTMRKSGSAHPANFRPEFYRGRLAMYEFCITCEACGGTGEDPEEMSHGECIYCNGVGHGAEVPWIVIALDVNSRECYVYHFDQTQQDKGREEFQTAMARFSECVEEDSWCRPAEMVSWHPTRPVQHWEEIQSTYGPDDYEEEDNV